MDAARLHSVGMLNVEIEPRKQATLLQCDLLSPGFPIRIPKEEEYEQRRLVVIL